MAGALSIPGIIGFKVGPPIDKRGARGYELAVTVEFQDMKAFKAYIPHAHHRLVADFINGFAEGTPLSYQIDTAREVVAKL
ncbi:hypothetical protein K438DRAFT_1821836 [Mycena galopus ATCC 62051]|nr:hypothetical protein K438DRAFT_1821836 [Mycena galopus ATCC 62051]